MVDWVVLLVARSMLASAYQTKVRQDDAYDSHAKPRRPFAAFLLGFMQTKWGLADMVKNGTHATREGIAELAAEHPRLRVFGMIAGLYQPELYTPRLADVVMHIVRLAVPERSVEQVLGHYPEGGCWVATTHCLRIIDKVFPPAHPQDKAHDSNPVSLWVDALPLAPDVRKVLLQHVRTRADLEPTRRVAVETGCPTRWDFDKFVALATTVR